jgi:hypothetical protein
VPSPDHPAPEVSVDEDSVTYRIPKEPVEVDLRLEGGRSIHGQVFATSVVPHHSGPERVLDMLNREDHPYLPVKDERGGSLVHKDRIVMVRSLDERDSRLTFADPVDQDEVRVLLLLAGGEGGDRAGGEELEGTIVLEGPPERRRLLDHLNAAPRFFPLVRQDGAWLVNQDFLVTVRELGQDE